MSKIEELQRMSRGEKLIKTLSSAEAMATRLDRADREFLELLLNAGAEYREQVEKLQEQVEKLQALVSRLKIKNGNYRLGMKQLQRAHEALKHRFNTLKSSTERENMITLEINQQVANPEPGYTDYFLQRALDNGGRFESRAQTAGMTNTRL